MAKGFKHGAGGGTSLNFKVVGGTAQPETTAENTIWVNTETDISGWVFSPAEPENPAEGLVWIEVGTASPAAFNILKKNTVYVFPASCKQFVGGAWANVFAYICQSGEWVQFSEIVTELYLYDSGEQYTGVTGGWKALDAYTLNETYINLTVAAQYAGRQAFTLSPVDMSGYSKLNVEVTNWSKVCYLGINNTKPNDYVWNDPNFSNQTDCEAITEITANGTVSLDISSMSGSFYVWLGKPGQNTSNEEGCYIKKVWLS